MKEASHLSRCVKGTLRDMENVVGNFVTFTNGLPVATSDSFFLIYWNSAFGNIYEYHKRRRHVASKRKLNGFGDRVIRAKPHLISFCPCERS